MKGKFVLLPHTTDAFIQANGQSLEELFENSALGLFDVMTDTATIEAARTEKIEVDGRNELELLYNWLETLLVKFETDSIVYSRFNVDKIERQADGSLKLKASIQGEEFSRKKHLPKVEVKAVTYHQMSITKNDGLWQALFILDL